MSNHDEASWQRWRQARHDELAGPDSWLGLVGLFWLESGRNLVGRGADARVMLPDGPPVLGEILVSGDDLAWQAAAVDGVLVDEQPAAVAAEAEPAGAPLPLASDRSGAPTVLGWGGLRFFVIERDGRFAVRVRNRNWTIAQPFAGVELFPYAPGWVLEAEWQVLPVPRSIEVPAVTGELKRVEISHRAVFEFAGTPVELLPLSVDEQAVFFVFRDRTSGRSTYGGGRFLRTRPARDGVLRLDFNRAYNPPCAFSPFATCPLPPPENWLSFAVEAGEQRYLADAGH